MSNGLEFSNLAGLFHEGILARPSCKRLHVILFSLLSMPELCHSGSLETAKPKLNRHKKLCGGYTAWVVIRVSAEGDISRKGRLVVPMELHPILRLSDAVVPRLRLFKSLCRARSDLSLLGTKDAKWVVQLLMLMPSLDRSSWFSSVTKQD